MAMSQTTDDRLSLEDYERMREPEPNRSELVRGRLVKEPPPGASHGRIQTLLARYLDSFVEEHGLGRVLTDVGVVLDERGPTVRAPDVLFVSTARVPGGLPSGFLRVAPDLAVEIVSTTNTASEVQEKILMYLDAGTRLVWVVDPRSRSATVYRSRQDVEIVGEDEFLEGGDVLPAFTLQLRTILRD